MLHGGIRSGRRTGGAGGIWPAVPGNAALLFPDGRPRLGDLCCSGEPVLWERTAFSSRDLRAEVVEAFGAVRRGTAGGRVCGIVSAAGFPAACVGADAAIEN